MAKTAINNSKTSVPAIFNTMDYGPAPEAENVAKVWQKLIITVFTYNCLNIY